MNWVAPIKDEQTLQSFYEALKRSDIKYYILFRIGVGTGLQLQDLLKYQVRDLKGKTQLKIYIGSHKVKMIYDLPEDLIEAIEDHTSEMEDDMYVFHGHKMDAPLSREQAYRALKAVSMSVGISSIGAQTMRKTYAWRYYNETGDIYYLQKLFNHASPSITYRFIGEKPNLEVPMKKMTASENERSRKVLTKEGQARIAELIKGLELVGEELQDLAKTDAFYGSVECLLNRMEELYGEFRSAVKE